MLQLFYPTMHIPVIMPNSHAKSQSPESSHKLAWKPKHEFQLSLYLSTIPEITELKKRERFFYKSKLLWQSDSYLINTKRENYPKVDESINVPFDDIFRTTNGSIFYIHAFVHDPKRMYWKPIPESQGQKIALLNLNDPDTLYTVTPLIRHMPRIINTEHHLLSGKKAASAERDGEKSNTDTKQEQQNHDDDKADDIWVPHIKSRIALEIMLEDHHFPAWQWPNDIIKHIRVIKPPKQKAKDSAVHDYLPLFWENPLSIKRDDYVTLTNNTIVDNNHPLAEQFTLRLQFNSIMLGWFRLSSQLDNTLKQFSSPRSVLKFSDKELDRLRHTFFEVNPTLVTITMLASLFHVLFEFLAYKEDISFWASGGKGDKNQQDEKSRDPSLENKQPGFEGISRSMVWMGLASAWCSVFYVWEQKQETSVIVLFGAVVRAFVETWKIKKLLTHKSKDITKEKEQSAETSINDHEHSEQSSNSESRRIAQVQQEVDKQTTWYITHYCIPGMIAYSAFSLVYMQYKSMFSWLIHVLVVTIYSLEFVQMWPQLIINHKLKTVDTLPLSAFCYRFLTTFIDDLFAMVIPMPLLTRLGTFRDDIVFVVLCWQWWTYPKRQKEKQIPNDKNADSESKKDK
ncbi:Cleft lip and palate associated transmembrane protein 1 [Mycoemilia scoparia]|uniref:Cleft lip and palate associated transmembrane protein 1 n=1 Tax=Mycoemilia scoparia TaxID=417184 RepID=A0A9W8A2I3_9FUNG|nr:Cleft lip and palate associated transmembrane protein 1 [Mycoemilia scoparia]